MAFIIDGIWNFLNKPGPLKPPPIGFEVTTDGNNYVAICPPDFGVDPGDISTSLPDQNRRCHKPLLARAPGVQANDTTCPPGTFSDGRKCYQTCENGYEEIIEADPSGQGVIVVCKGACHQEWHPLSWSEYKPANGQATIPEDINFCVRRAVPSGFRSPTALQPSLGTPFDGQTEQCLGIKDLGGKCEGTVLKATGTYAPRKSHDLGKAFLPAKCQDGNDVLRDGSCVKPCTPGTKVNPDNPAYCFNPQMSCKDHPDLFVDSDKDDLAYCKARVLPGKRSPSIIVFAGMAITGIIVGYFVVKLITTKRK